MAAEQFLLGLDIGTSTVKGVLVSKSKYSHEIIEEFSIPTLAQTSSSINQGVEQEVTAIVSALEKLIAKFSEEHLKRVVGLGISGQMHGIVLWKSGLSNLCNDHIFVDIQSTSSLVTWQDGRCDVAFLSSLPQTQSLQSMPIKTGYGCATLFWYIRNGYDISRFNRAGTIMDYIVYLLCGCDKVIMSSQNAYSWGYFDNEKFTWEYDILAKATFPVHLLPQVVMAPSMAGKLIGDWCGLLSGLPVSVAMGDLQCSVSAVDPKDTDAVINIGTAIQASVIVNTTDSLCPSCPTLLHVPYFNGKTLLVAAILTGADVIAKMVEFFKEFLKGVGVFTVSDETIYSYLIQSSNEKLNTSLQIRPLLYGERHCSTERGSVTNICTDNCSVGDVSCATIKGIVSNIKDMFPLEILRMYKINNIIGSGSTCHKNSVLIELIKKEYKLPMDLKDGADASLGAAIVMSQVLNN